MFDINPYYKGFTGNITKISNTKYETSGKVDIIDHNVKVSELPIMMWTDKYKEFCEGMLENKKIKKIDKDLENNGSVIAHKLCGAGNGGGFLTFSKKNTLTIPYSAIRIHAVPDGVKGESI